MREHQSLRPHFYLTKPHSLLVSPSHQKRGEKNFFVFFVLCFQLQEIIVGNFEVIGTRYILTMFHNQFHADNHGLHPAKYILL